MKITWQDKYQTITHEYDDEDFDIWKAFEYINIMLQAVTYHPISIENAVLDWADNIRKDNKTRCIDNDDGEALGYCETGSPEERVQAEDGSSDLYCPRCGQFRL